MRGHDDRWDSARLRRRVFEIIEIGRGEDRTSKLFDSFIVLLILANIAAFCAETVPHIHAAYGGWLHAFEIASVAVFTIEYILRLWTAVEVPFLSRLSPLQARLHFARRPLLIFDLLAVLPFYLGSMMGLDLRILRAFRLLRLFKLSRYSPAMHTLVRVLANESRTLTGAGLLLLLALLFSSTGMYFIEGREQPDKFGSVPLAAYWAMTTLTTVGYGDVVPITPLGKLWAMLTMLFGLCILALPVAIISSGFAQEAGRRDFVVTWSLMSRIPLLAELDTSQVAELMPLLHAQHLPPNTQIMAAGSPGHAMYFVASGNVRLQAGNATTEYTTGDFFGIVALLDGDVQPGRFVTLSRCRLLKLYRDDFYRIEVASPQIGAHIRQVAANRKAARQAAEATARAGGGSIST
ncbi:MAG: cyclic nucleotide-gated ion channel [Hyphomicrobiaceae bacterium]